MKSEHEFKEKVLEKSREYKRKRSQRIKTATVGVSFVCTALICIAVMPKAFNNEKTVQNESIELYTAPKEEFIGEVVDKNSQMPPASKEVPHISVNYNGTEYQIDSVVFENLKPHLNVKLRSESTKSSNVCDALASESETEEASTKLLTVTFDDGEEKEVYTLIGDEITPEIKTIIGIEE